MDPLAFQQTVLPSGATVVWQDRSDAEYVVLGAFVRAGSINDPPGKDGLAHLLEHMTFEGSHMLPTNLALTSMAERHGGNINAGTAVNMTMYYVAMPEWKGRDAGLLLLDLVFHPVLQPNALTSQVDDIINEIASMANDVPTRRNIRRENRLMFGPEFARRAGVLGTATSLKRIRHRDVVAFHRQHYHPANMVFLAVGNLRDLTPDWPTFLEQHLPVVSAGTPTAWPSCPLTAASQPGYWVTPRHDDLVPRLTIGARLHYPPGMSLDELRHRQRTSGLLQHLLGGGQSSLIFQRIREQSNLAYDGVSDLSILTSEAVTWDFQATTRDETEMVELYGTIADLLRYPRRIRTNDIEWAREALYGAWALQDYTPTVAFQWASRFIPEGHPIPTRDDWRQMLERVSCADVRRLIEQDLHPRRWVAVCYQPASA